ncbi:MAG TPA: hypothetical protein VGM94_14185 [Galbitalea sp.]
MFTIGLPNRRLRVAVVALTAGLLIVPLVAGCTATKSTTVTQKSSATPPPKARPAAVPYAGNCPAEETISAAVGKTMSLRSQKPNGAKFDCSYAGSGGSLVVAFTSNDGTTPAQLHTDLAETAGHAKVTVLPGVGQAAYEYVAANKDVVAVAINHGFTVSTSSTGLTAAATITAETVSVGIGGH